MSYAIKWDNVGERFYETGVKNGVLYVQQASGAYGAGVPWNGLTAVTESPSGAEATALYADDTKYLNLVSAEEFSGTIEAYTYPTEFMQCDGTAAVIEGMYIGQQARTPFGLCYSTVIGNDTVGEGYGEKIHIVYGALAAPSEKAYSTINDSPEAITFSWEFSTTPVDVAGYKKTATVVIDSTKISAAALTAIKEALYGVEGESAKAPSLLLPAEIKALIEANPAA